MVAPLKNMEYEVVGNIIIDEKRLLAENDPYGLNLENVKRKDAHADKRMTDEHKIELFETLSSMITRELESKVSALPGYTEIDKEMDPIGLWGLITAAVISKSTGSTRANKAVAITEWGNLTQGPGETVVAFKARAVNKVAQLKLVGAEPVTDIDQATRLIVGLNEKYDSLKAQLNNNEALGKRPSWTQQH